MIGRAAQIYVVTTVMLSEGGSVVIRFQQPVLSDNARAMDVCEVRWCGCQCGLRSYILRFNAADMGQIGVQV